jgi:hypothetical protein
LGEASIVSPHFGHFLYASVIIAYNILMADEKAAEERFDAILRRMLDMKPMTAKELSAKLKAEKAAKIVQKMDEPNNQRAEEE